jgi:hypothetical protein
MAKGRVPMQVSPSFEKKMKELQKRIMMKEGVMISLRDLTEKIDLNNMEEKLLKNSKTDIKISLDRRKI